MAEGEKRVTELIAKIDRLHLALVAAGWDRDSDPDFAYLEDLAADAAKWRARDQEELERLREENLKLQGGVEVLRDLVLRADRGY